LFDRGQTTLVAYPGGKAGDYTIPSSVTTILDYALADCSLLSGVTIPNSVSAIGGAAFQGCLGLTTVTIPQSVTSLGAAVFVGCSLNSITVDSLNSFYSSVDGVLFNRSQTTLITYPAFKDGTYAVPESVTSIASWAFAYAKNLSSVTLGGNVTDIGSYGFAGCDNLSTVTMSSGIIRFGYAAFSSCSSLGGIYFYNNGPADPGSTLFNYSGEVTVYYLPGTLGWGPTFGGRPTAQWLLPYPVILSSASGFGIQTNGFGFIISWATNASVVVEASTSVTNPMWIPVGTNSLEDGWSYFSDAEWTNYPRRFYRVRWP